MDFYQNRSGTGSFRLSRHDRRRRLHPRHQRALDALDERFDTELWSKLIDADILSTAAPESVGGGGFGVLEQVAVLSALGRQLAAVPYLESVVLAAGALAHFGSAALQQDWAGRPWPAQRSWR